MKRELDSLLERLRQIAVPDIMLDGVERGVWQQIAAREALTLSTPLRLSFQVASVAAAFLLGIVLGVDVAESAQATQASLVEEMNLLPPDGGSPFL